MVASLINNDTTVALIYEDGKKHIVDLDHLAEADLAKLKRAAYKNLFDVNAVHDQLWEFIRRINKVLDTRVNNTACLDILIP